MNDEYANFILQIVINMKIVEINDEIYGFLCNNILELSKKKYSSNVIDKVSF